VIWRNAVLIGSGWTSTLPRSQVIVVPGLPPDFFVFAVGDVNPPCFMIREIAYDIEESPQPAVPIVRDGTKIEFYTNDRKLIRVEY
jgi:hypothetical protein